MLKNVTLEMLVNAYEKKGNKLTQRIELVAIRAAEYDTNAFDDLIGFIHLDIKGTPIDYKLFGGTTDPGFAVRGDSVPDGTAMLKAGYYPNFYARGNHKNNPKHPAFVQVSPGVYYRKKNGKMFSPENMEKRIIGSNLHTTSENYNPLEVDNYSKSCMVVRLWDSFQDKFIDYVDSVTKQPRFNFNLLLETEL
jgi:hypothetical protein